MLLSLSLSSRLIIYVSFLFLLNLGKSNAASYQLISDWLTARSLEDVIGPDKIMDSTGGKDTLECQGHSPPAGHHSMSWAQAVELQHRCQKFLGCD